MSVNDPLVSVVIPTYNKSSSIEMTVKSVLRQSYPNIEIVLVDNGSSDSTRDLILRMSETTNNLKVILMSENLGPSNARNIGIKNSAGRYIFLLDGDDLFHPEKIVTQVDFMRLNPEFALSVTSYLISNEDGHRPRLIKFKSVASLINGWIRMTGFGGLVESTGCIDASRIQDPLLFDVSLMGSEGLDFMMKWNQKYPIGMIQKPLTLYLLSDSQLHLNTAAIRENVTRLNPKYIQGRLRLEYTRRLQSSFFTLDGMRKDSPKKVFIKLCRSLNIYLVIMCYSILKRNLTAYISGLKSVSIIDEFFGSSTRM